MSKNLKRTFPNSYNFLFFLMLILRNILSEAIQLKILYIKSFCRISFVLVSLLIGVELIQKIFRSNFNLNQINLLIVVLIIALIGILSKNTRILFMSFIILICFFMDIQQIIDIYFITLLLMLFFVCIMQLLGLATVYKNTTGYFMFASILFIFFRLKNKNTFSSFFAKAVLLIIGIECEQLIHDRTAEYLIIVFAVLYFLRILQINNKIFRFLIIFLPVFLTILSIYFAKNYGRYNWITININNLFSDRVAIWNNIWQFCRINLFPQNIEQYAYGYSTVLNKTITATDGFFAVGLLEYGILIYFIYNMFIIMTVAKYYNNKKPNIEFIYCIIIFLLYGFTETIIDNSYLCFVIPLAFSYLASYTIDEAQ